MSALISAAAGTPALAATFVYVSNAEDGSIGIYTLQPDGGLQPGARAESDFAFKTDGSQTRRRVTQR